MRYRPHTWVNTKTLEPVYGIQARVGPRDWRHVAENSVALLFERAEDRDAKLNALRQEPTNAD